MLDDSFFRELFGFLFDITFCKGNKSCVRVTFISRRGTVFLSLDTHTQQWSPPLSLLYIFSRTVESRERANADQALYTHTYIYTPPNYPLLLDEREKGPANVLSFIFGFLFSLFCICWMAAAAEASPPIFYSFLIFFSRLLFTFVYIPRTIFVRPPFGMTIQSRAPKNPGRADPTPNGEKKDVQFIKRERESSG